MTGVDKHGIVHGFKPGTLRYGIGEWGTYCGAWASEPQLTPKRIVTCMTCLVTESRR